MRLHRTLGAGALMGLVLVLAGSAQANYSYNVTVTPNLASFGQTTVSLAGRAGVALQGTNSVSLATLVLNSLTPPSSTDTVADFYTLTVQINDPSVTGASGNFTIRGELSGTANANSSNIDNTYLSVSPSSQTIGSDVFSMSVGTFGVPDFFYQPATVNGAEGGLGGKIIATSTPEPTSLAVCGIAGLLLLKRRRVA